MNKPVRAPYIILICTVLLAVGTEASVGPEITTIYSEGEKVHYYNMDQPMQYREQTNTLSSLHNVSCNSQIDHPLTYCPQNELAQKFAESNALITYQQSTNTKRPEQAKEENTLKKKQKKTEKSKASSLDAYSTGDVALDRRKLEQIKKNISVWNNSRLKNKHRESLHLGYKPAVTFNKFGHNKYKKIGDEIHQSLIETNVKHCKAVYSKIPVQNEFWFAIASKSTYTHIKFADCQAMDTNPSEYKFIEDLSGYYPGLPGDIVRYMDKHGPIISDQKSIKTEWNETLGDIYVRKPAESEYGIRKETITVEANNEYNRSVVTAVRMILALPEVHEDLFNLTAVFIEKTLKEETDSNHLKVVRALHKIVEKQKNTNQSELDKEYAVLCNAFIGVLYQIDASYKFMVIQLYAEMYKSLVYFYKKAEVCEEILDIKKKRGKVGKDKEYYLLAGKCIIKPQRYLKCTTSIDLNKLVGENTHQITEETDKWSIPSDIHYHYHIHYVDNTKQKYTRVCMPMCLRPIHTIGQIVEYLKRLYNIETEECISPYIRNNLGHWMYISKEDRDKTVKEFAYCDIVFYYIEEGIKENYFTFAEFESHKKPEGKTVRIPLFLSPLMRSAVSMGPFEEENKKEHKLVGSMRSWWMRPGVYTYKEEYKATEYFHVHYYYSNLYIRRGNADVPTIDCYIMDSKATISNDTATVEWYAKIPNSVDEYTHYILSDDLVNDQDKYNALSKAVKSHKYTPDSVLYGFGLQNSTEKTSELDDMRCSTDDSISHKDILDCKLSIMPLHKTPPKIANLQSDINKIIQDIKQINKTINDLEITEKQKKTLIIERESMYRTKFNKNQMLNQMHILVKEEPDVTPLPSCAFFIVFRHSNTQSHSNLGAHNELLDALTCRYNISN